MEAKLHRSFRGVNDYAVVRLAIVKPQAVFPEIGPGLRAGLPNGLLNSRRSANVLATHANASTAGRPMSGTEGRICRQDSEAFETLYEHLGKYPACPYLVRYNKAIALAAYDEPSASKEAHRILDQLAALQLSAKSSRPGFRANADITITHRAVLELRINALSAKTNMIAARGVAPRRICAPRIA
jgi:hypothetical protein